MARFVNYIFFLLTVFMLFSATTINAQIMLSGADTIVNKLNENFFIFCADNSTATVGTLTAKSPMVGSSTFTWEKYDTISGAFAPYNGSPGFEDTLQSTISRLDDGLYKVTINTGGNIYFDQAWVMNNWIEVTRTEIPDSSSTCDGFKIWADYAYSPLIYFDTESNERKTIRTIGSFKFLWKGSGLENSTQNPYVFPPIASDDPIEYNLTVTDQFGCQGKGSVEYDSKVPKSDFTYDPDKGEAVLKVTFAESSINYDSILWCFYKDKETIAREIDKNDGEAVDSIDFILLGAAPVYEYERTGNYLVKVVTVHVNPTTGNCYDTMYMKTGEFIYVDTSLVRAPNVFTPNGDDNNEVFVVQSKSLQRMSVQIYNRWGGLVHKWSYSNIRGRDYTYEHSVWDGKIGGRMASPGVYFYVIRAVGRDGKTRNKNGFVHLFRNKD